jgi:hypothetical protein
VTAGLRGDSKRLWCVLPATNLVTQLLFALPVRSASGCDAIQILGALVILTAAVFWSVKLPTRALSSALVSVVSLVLVALINITGAMCRHEMASSDTVLTLALIASIVGVIGSANSLLTSCGEKYLTKWRWKKKQKNSDRSMNNKRRTSNLATTPSVVLSDGDQLLFLNSLPFLSHPLRASSSSAGVASMTKTKFSNSRRVTSTAASPPCESLSTHVGEAVSVSEHERSSAASSGAQSSSMLPGTPRRGGRGSSRQRHARRDEEAIVPLETSQDEEVLQTLEWVIEKICVQNSNSLL